MAEPEDLLIDAAHFASRAAVAAWRKHGPARDRHLVLLADVRLRIELFLHAMVGHPVAVAAAEPPAPVSWLARLARGAAPAPAAVPPGTDGRRVYLPPWMDAAAGRDAAVARYLLLGIGQALRLQRGTASVALSLPWAAAGRFLLAEAAAVDRETCGSVPGLRTALLAARRDAVARRGASKRSGSPGGSLDALIDLFLAADPLSPPGGIPAPVSARESMAWATRVPVEGTPSEPRTLRARPLPYYWGTPLPVSSLPGCRPAPAEDAPGAQGRTPPRVAEMRRRPRVREAADDEDDQGTGAWIIRADEPQETVEDPFGLQRPADRADEADPDGLGDSLSELPDARVIRTPGRTREVLRAGEPMESVAREGALGSRPGGLVYPEWDYAAGHYRPRGAVIREAGGAPGQATWAAAALARHAALVRRVSVRFQRLRPGLTTVNRQPDGSALDIAACVSAAADARAGGLVDDRLYLQQRPLRRALSVALLVDVSASTDSWVCGTQRIVDVEKEALLVVCQALDALRDRYAIFAFSGEGPDHVSLVAVKRFGETSGSAVGLRIAGLEADGYTRLGAAVRHATAALEQDGGRHRLLLILSDGKPNDVDRYAGTYGIEDARMAVAEARRHRTEVFCLTVDREAPLYAPRIFGKRGFALLRRPGQLPVVLIDVLRRLIRP